MSDKKPDLNDLMLALGSVVVIWGMLEDVVRELTLDVVLGLKRDDSLERIVISEISFRNQLDILKKAAHMRRPNSEWFANLEGQLGPIRGNLHAERNRLIHDLWATNDDGQIVKSVRGKEEASVVKKGGTWTLQLSAKKAIPIAEVEDFFERVADSVSAMTDLKSDYSRLWYEETKANLFQSIQEKVARRLPDDPAPNPISELLAGIAPKAN